MESAFLEFDLSDNERIVRTYECTKRARLFASAINGYLTVTNKRIVYHSRATSLNGSSSILSELPLDDYSGVSASLSNSFNWIFFIVFCFALYLITAIASNILPEFLTGWVMSILLLLPYLIGLLFEKNILNQDIQRQFLENINEIPGSSFFTKRQMPYYMAIFKLLFYFGLALLAWNISQNDDIRSQASIITFPLLLASYYLIYRIIFGSLRTFSLAVTSKSSKNSGIVIPGNPLGLLFGGDTSALQSLYAGPGKDAETVVQELGALLADIRQLGDLGINKWSR